MESEIDKVSYKWEKSAVSRWYSNAANTSKRAARPEMVVEMITALLKFGSIL